MGDAEGIQIDRESFQERISSFTTQWKNDKRSGDTLFGGVGSIVVVMGKTDETLAFQKHNAFQFWLLGYEFPATLMLLTPETMYVVTTKKKASYLEPLKGGKVPLEIFTRGKDAEENGKIFERCLEIIKTAGKKVGTLPKTQITGPFVDEWKTSFETIQKDIEEVDISAALSSAAMAVKDEQELRMLRDASRISSGIMRRYFVDEMSDILDEERKVSNSALSEKVERKIDDNKFLTEKIRLSKDFDAAQLDWSYQPVIQSGGNYDLKTSAEADNKNLHAGVIIARMGIRYQSYSSFIARTYMVDPNKSQENNYKVLLAAHEAVLKAVKEGVAAKDVYEKALSVVKAKKPDLEKHFLKSVGFGIGLEPRDGTLVLNAKSNRTLKDGQTLVIWTGFSDLTNPDAKDKASSSYSLTIADTVRVTLGDVVSFTKDAPVDSEGISFFYKDEEDEKPAKPKKDSRVGAVASNNITKTRLRNERATNQDAEKEAARKEHQKELHSKKQQQGMEKYGKGTGSLNGTEEKKFKKFESYKRDQLLPSKVKELVICVDQKAQSIVLPIMGRPVPFHINTIKNASTNDEGPWTYLRINFLSPGQGVGRKDDQPFEDPDAHFVRSLTFRSKDKDRMSQISADISELKKSSVRKEQEKKELEDVVEQDRLIEQRSKKPGNELAPCFLRPALEGKRLAGHVEIHQNGLRYVHPTGQRVDILFSNVKHLFFQPCDHELIVLIHVHLVNPIIIGKRKTKDVQFYREATEMSVDETGNRKRKFRYGDEEEFEAEQEERRHRARVNREFKQFTERISDAGRSDSLAVDIPFRELGFTGVHSRSSVLIQPSTDCLVQLTEPPFMVVSLSEIEVVHLERVQFGLKNFDMVCVFSDFQRPPIHINTIPVENLDAVKDWLDSVDIPFSDGPLNLNWPAIMKTVTVDPHAFFADGGWSFLSNDSDDENGGSDEEEEESAFEIDDSEVAEMSQESSEADSDFDDDASADASEDEGSAVSEGEDWDELDRKAAKKDRESGLDGEDSRKGAAKKKR